MPTNKELEKNIKELEKNIVEMAKAVKDLSSDISEIKKKTITPIETLEDKSSTTGNYTPVETQEDRNSTTSAYPIPREYREIVNNTLNKKFDIDIEWKPAGIVFTVIVPEKYSPLKTEEKKLIKEDRRTKIIPNYEGANGVRLWVEKVYNSFSEETKSLISLDR